MKPFEELSRDEQIKRLQQLGAVALKQYKICNPRMKFLADGVNVVFRVEAEEAEHSGVKPFVLRIHPPSTPAIETELRWLVALRRDTDLVVPEPMPTRDGSLLHEVTIPGIPETRRCVLFRWVEGKFLDAELTPDHLQQVGALTAHLHQHSEEFAASEKIDRWYCNWKYWEWESSLVSSDILNNRDTVAQVRFSARDRKVVTTTRERVITEISNLPEDKNFGLIHGDLSQWNYLFHDGSVRVIDFDNCYVSYHIIDIVTTLEFLQGRKTFEAMRDALLDGYASVRPLPEGCENLIETFLIAGDLIRFNSALRSNDSEEEQFVRDFVERCQRYLRGNQIGEVRSP